MGNEVRDGKTTVTINPEDFHENSSFGDVLHVIEGHNVVLEGARAHIVSRNH